MTGLDWLPRLARSERQEALRGIFVSYALTSEYVPPAGVTPETTTTASAPAILAAFAKASTGLQDEYGHALWWSLLKVEQPKDVWVRVLRELEPIARKGYADPTFTSFYDSFLKELGLTFAGVFSGKPDAGSGP